MESADGPTIVRFIIPLLVAVLLVPAAGLMVFFTVPKNKGFALRFVAFCAGCCIPALLVLAFVMGRQ